MLDGAEPEQLRAHIEFALMLDRHRLFNELPSLCDDDIGGEARPSAIHIPCKCLVDSRGVAQTSLCLLKSHPIDRRSPFVGRKRMLSGNWLNDVLAMTSLMVLALFYIIPFIVCDEHRSP